MASTDSASAGVVLRSSGAAPKMESLAAHNALSIRTAADLTTLASASEALALREVTQALASGLEHLASGAFVVAIVGEFKRGKSTLANALLGAEIMPADVLPATAAVNRVVYGRNPLATLRFKDGSTEVVPIEELRDHVTKLDDQRAERAATIEEAVVALPTHLCRQNVELIDTPGLGDEAAMTERTAHAIRSVDAAIIVTSAVSPFAQSEAEILQELLQHVDRSRLFFVIGQIDLVPEKSVDRVLAAVERRIRQALGDSTAPLRLFPLSAREALLGKLERNSARLASSRFEAFEAELERFLVRDRGLAMIQIASEAVRSASVEIAAAARARLGTIEAEEARRDRALAEQELALRELSEAASCLREGLAVRAERVAATGAWYSSELAPVLLRTARVTLDELVLSEEEVTDATRRHERVAQQIAPRFRALLAECASCSLQALIAWADAELTGLAELAARLEALLERRSEQPAAQALATEGHPSGGRELLGAAATSLLELEASFAISFEPQRLGSSVRSLMGEIAGIDVVKKTWLVMQGREAQRVLGERTQMMAKLLQHDYAQHFEEAVPHAVQQAAPQKRFDQAFRHLADKIQLKVQGETALVEKVCEIQPWELRVARQWARAEGQREVERVSSALTAAERASNAALARLAIVQEFFGDTTRLTAEGASDEHG